MTEPLEYYHLEAYLFETVRERFLKQGSIEAFDFFSIVIWKANRAKSKVAKRLLERDRQHRDDLDAIARDLTSQLGKASDRRERLRVLIEDWGFRIPIASAILTVFWPEEFTVYDVRACEALGIKCNLADEVRMDRLWPKYDHFIELVRAVPGGVTLRDKDRALWARSAAEQLTRDIARRFVQEVRN